MPTKSSLPASQSPPIRFALNLPEDNHNQPNDSATSDSISPPVFVSQPASRHPSRSPSPFTVLPPAAEWARSESPGPSGAADRTGGDEFAGSDGLELTGWNESDSDGDVEEIMPSDLRPHLNRPTDGRSYTPLLSNKGDQERQSYDSPSRQPPILRRRSTFHERDPDLEAKSAARKKYTYAAAFLLLSLISFTVQTETAVYIQHNLHWDKAYCMLYLTHGSWSLLWPAQLLLLRLQKWSMPWPSFWRRHVQILRSTAQMVEHQTLHPTGRAAAKSPVPYVLRMTALTTSALTIAGGSWYIAVNLTTASDLTAIYNCSAFFAYAFSIPLLHERIRFSKVAAVAIAIAGVLVVAYGDRSPSKHGSKSGGGTGGPASGGDEASNRALGNIIIGIGSVLYGFYEVLYKRVACPPEGTSPGRGMIFANTFGSLIGCFTLFVLWFPLPILHYTGLETFELPKGEAAWMLAISVLANATFSGSFLVLISLTSPVLSSVAALLTIFLVALVDQLLPPPLNTPLSGAAVAGGCLIIGAFLLLSWATYRELNDERLDKFEDVVSESDLED